MCDGENTVEGIAQIIYKNLDVSMSEAKTSLSSYFEQLAKKGLIVFIVTMEMQDRIKELSEKLPYTVVPAGLYVVFCGYCGAQNSKISNYCLRCGQKLRK